MPLAYLVAESPANLEIFQTLLPSQLVAGLKFVADRQNPELKTQSVLSTQRVPVVMVLNANTHDQSMIHERLDLLNYLVRNGSIRIPFKIFMAVPEVEVIFCQHRPLLEELTHQHLTDLEWHFAQRHPKDYLDTLPSGSAAFVERVLNTLTSEQIQILRQHPLVCEVAEFLAKVTHKAAVIS